MGKKKKDSDWYDAKMKDLKNRKRESCGSVSDSEYGSITNGKYNNKSVKKLKEEFKKEKRSYKRAEKQNWKEEVKDILDDLDIDY